MTVANAADQFAGTDVVTIDRRSADDRRDAQAKAGCGEDGSDGRKTQRRRHIDPTTCERDYSGQEIEFMRAMDAYKQQSGRMFPTCSEVLEVIRSLGYVQLDEQQQGELGIDIEVGYEEEFDVNADDDASEMAEV